MINVFSFGLESVWIMMVLDNISRCLLLSTRFFERKMEISGLSIGGKKMKYKKFENTIIARLIRVKILLNKLKILL